MIENTPANPLEPSPQNKRPYNLAEIVFIRDEIKFQHALIGTRISWFVGAQAFMVTPFAISLSSSLLFTQSWPLAFIGIPFLGIALSVLIVSGISQATLRIDQQQKLIKAYDSAHLLQPRNDDGHIRALLFAAWVPWLFLAFWAAVVLAGAGWYVCRHQHCG